MCDIDLTVHSIIHPAYVRCSQIQTMTSSDRLLHMYSTIWRLGILITNKISYIQWVPKKRRYDQLLQLLRDVPDVTGVVYMYYDVDSNICYCKTRVTRNTSTPSTLLDGHDLSFQMMRCAW